MSEEEYNKLTYATTVHFAKVLEQQNPDLIFNFISGGHTDSTESGKVMWARVKGKTENALIKIFPGKSYNFRPSLMKPTKGQKNFKGYNKIAPTILFPILKLFFPHSTMTQIGRAMINATILGYEKPVLEVKDINELSAKEVL